MYHKKVQFDVRERLKRGCVTSALNFEISNTSEVFERIRTASKASGFTVDVNAQGKTETAQDRISARWQIGDKTRAEVTEIIKTKRSGSVTRQHRRSAGRVSQCDPHTHTRACDLSLVIVSMSALPPCVLFRIGKFRTCQRDSCFTGHKGTRSLGGQACPSLRFIS